MSFTTKNYIGPPINIEDNNLNLEEIQYLLILIKDSSFKGEQLQLLYNIVYKLQNQYLEKQKTNV